MAIELSSKKSARLNQILSMLEETSTLSVKEIAQRLNVSEMTIRRDLKAMQQDEIIRRSHGKASLMQSSSDLSALVSTPLRLFMRVMFLLLILGRLQISWQSIYQRISKQQFYAIITMY